jgi:hypothetical protein
MENLTLVLQGNEKQNGENQSEQWLYNIEDTKGNILLLK